MAIIGAAKQIHWKALFQKRNQNANSGIVYVWAVGAIFMIVIAFIWYALVWPLTEFMDTVEGLGSFSAGALSTMSLIRNIINWLPIGAILALGLWMFVNSMRREDATYGL